MSTFPQNFQPSGLPGQPPNYAPAKNQRGPSNPQKPLFQSPLFNKNPLQPIPYKEALILLSGTGAIYGLYKGHRLLVSGKDKIGHAKALMYSPFSAAAGAIFFMGAMPVIDAWNYWLERKRKRALGIPVSFIADIKNSWKNMIDNLKGMVSSGSPSQ